MSEPAPAWWTWTLRLVALVALITVAWAALTGWGAIVHGFPLYGPLLVVTVVVAVLVLWWARRRRPVPTGWRLPARIALVVAGVGWIAAMAWLRPFTAVEPALAAMHSDATVTVTESATRVVLEPVATPAGTGVFFQPGAKVDARAYAAVLRPLAEAGYPVVVAKQPLNIAFLAIGAFDSARSDFPGVTHWVVGGHSLGGTVAAMEADGGQSVVGLLFYASYPAGDLSQTLTADVLSLSGSHDGLATPAKIDRSRADLPSGSTFTVIDGAVHAYFGDYGPQPGDGTPTISHDDARRQISDDTLAWVRGLAPGT